MKVRVRYSRHGRIRFISHRDTARIMERAFRKLAIPVVYSQGFSPRPKFSFGLALTVGHESEAEYLDVDLVSLDHLESLPQQLTQALPDGLTVEAAIQLDQGAASLQQVVKCCQWRIEVIGAPIEAVMKAVSALVAAPQLPLERERKGKTSVVDVRPAILELQVVGPTVHGVELLALLANEDLSIRPSELIRVLALDLREGQVCRTHQFTNAEGGRVEPIDRSNLIAAGATMATNPLAPSAWPAESQAS